jgi:hypothetical protein
MYPKDRNDEEKYSFDDNMIRMYKNDCAMSEIRDLYQKVNELSDKYELTLNSIVAELYAIDSHTHPITQEMIDKLDTVA